MKHTISVSVHHSFNALSRIVGLFSGRGYTIDSISFGEGEDPELARVTITARGDKRIIEQITKQLHKLIDVVKVTDLTNTPYVERGLALIKVSTTSKTRSEVMEVVNIFRANIIDITPKTLTVEVTGKQDKVDAAINMLRPFGIREVARTGSVALKREFNSRN